MATSRSSPVGVASLRKDAARGVGEPALPFRRVLIANRGEIAVRIIRACRELGIEAIAIYSDADAEALHTRLADVAIRIGPPAPNESYLRIDGIVDAALAAGADAVHPGYGFLAERAAFARAVEAAGLVFVGPSPDAIDALGDKLHARRLARSVDVPVVPGTLEPAPVERPDQVAAIVAEAEAIGFPLLVKAAAGGGGRGMRRVATPAELPAALAAGSAEATSAFGDGAVYLEREILPARHIEVQLLGDASGRVVAIGERDCSIQRRHQKLVEEAPAPGLTVADRRELHAMAVRLGEAAGLQNAATAEFLRGPDGGFAFLEVNTRLQVEHGVTELVTGLDLVREQLRLAAGLPLSDGRAGRRRTSGGARRSRDRGPHRGREPGRQLHPDAGPDHAVDDAGRAGRPGGQRRRSGRSGRARVRQPDREADGPRRGSGCRDRPPPPGARRDRDRGRPDDPAVPSLRRPGRELPGRCRLHRVGGRALRRTGGAPARPPSGQARRGPGGRRGARQPSARATRDGRSGGGPGEDGRWRAAGRADAMDRWPA